MPFAQDIAGRTRRLHGTFFGPAEEARSGRWLLP
jgi:hypothetical protein